MQIIGIGNKLRGDDGIGPAMIEELRQDNEIDRLADLIDISSDAFSLLDILSANGAKWIIDCADMACQPGTVNYINIDRNSMEMMNSMISLHSLSFAEVYQLAKILNPALECYLIAVQPASIRFNSKLSKEVKKKIPYIRELIRKEMRQYAE